MAAQSGVYNCANASNADIGAATEAHKALTRQSTVVMKHPELKKKVTLFAQSSDLVGIELIEEKTERCESPSHFANALQN